MSDDHQRDTVPRRPDVDEDESDESMPQVDWQIGADESAENVPRPDGVIAGLISYPTLDDKQANIARALQLAWEAADGGAEIIAFQEMFMLPWVFDDDEPAYDALADSADSTIWEQFQILAAEKQVVLVCPFFEAGFDGRYYNSTLVIDIDGYIVGSYRKRHLPPDNERVHFHVGTGPISTFPTHKGRIGVYICWDNFFPEGARALALDGADLVMAPSAATELESAYKWHIAIQHNAMVNGIPWIRINRAELPFYPTKFVADAEGKRKFYTDDAGQWISLVKIDYTQSDRVREQWTFLQDRRPEIYRQIVQE
jgi:predicted amidohydrolase